MAEENNTTTMNLDLNLGPVDNSSEDTVPPMHSYPVGAMNLQDWLDSPVRARHRNHRWRSLWRQIPITPETRNLALELIGPENGEGSIASDVRPEEAAAKTLEEDDGNKKDGEENKNCEEGSFFDCNICLDMSKDPVVTCCGHLFCWTCLYRWLHHHSDAKECPVCKGEVTAKNVTPIYGRGNNSNSTRGPHTDSNLKIPLRPQARRVESWRQAIQRSAFTIPMEEMIRRLGSTFDLSRERSQVQPQDPDGPRGDSPERSNNINNNNNSSLLNRILTSRGLRRERVSLDDDVIDLTAEDNSNSNNNTNNNNRRISSMLLRRSSSHRATSLSNLASALQSAESLAAVESYFNNNPVEGDQGRVPHVDDRDSVSSIAAVIQSESQTVDNTVEIDSRVSISTSSSRRRVDASRISDVDSGDSRAPRRRRLN